MRKIQWLNFPLFIKWYITSRCNLRCRHCYLTDYTKTSNLSDILVFVDYFGKKGVRGISILGGEPLVRDDLEIIVKRIRNHHITVTTATNGILATLSRAKSLVAAGVMKFQVSLEGPSAELNDPIRGVGTFGKVIEGIKNLKCAGANISLAFTLSKKNYREVDKMHALARDLKVDNLRLSAFAPIGTGRINQEEFLLTKEIASYIRKKLKSLQDQCSNLLIDSAFLKEAKSCSDCSATFGCGAGTTNMIINSDLSVSACDLLVEEDRTKIQITSPEQLESVWKEDPLFRKWRGEDVRPVWPIKSFKEVHQNGCHVIYDAYGENILGG